MLNLITYKDLIEFNIVGYTDSSTESVDLEVKLNGDLVNPDDVSYHIRSVKTSLKREIHQLEVHKWDCQYQEDNIEKIYKRYEENVKQRILNLDISVTGNLFCYFIEDLRGGIILYSSMSPEDDKVEFIEISKKDLIDLFTKFLLCLEIFEVSIHTS